MRCASFPMGLRGNTIWQRAGVLEGLPKVAYRRASDGSSDPHEAPLVQQLRFYGNGRLLTIVTSRRSSSCRPRRPGDATETSSETRVWGNHCCGCSWGPCSQSGGDPHARQDSPECARSSATAPGTSVLTFVTGRIVSRETAESERKEIPMRSIAVLGVLVGLLLVACWAPTAAAATLPAGTAGNALILPVDPYVAAA